MSVGFTSGSGGGNGVNTGKDNFLEYVRKNPRFLRGLTPYNTSDTLLTRGVTGATPGTGRKLQSVTDAPSEQGLSAYSGGDTYNRERADTTGTPTTASTSGATDTGSGTSGSGTTTASTTYDRQATIDKVLNRTPGVISFDPRLAYSKPNEAIENYFLSFLGPDDLLAADNPYIKYARSVAQGLPFLYDALGFADVEGAGAKDVTQYYQDFMNSFADPYSTDLTNSPMFNFDELTSLVQNMVSGGEGGNFTKQQGEYFRSLFTMADGDQAFGQLLESIATAGNTAMTPGVLNGVLETLQREYSQFKNSYGGQSFTGGITGNTFSHWFSTSPTLKRLFNVGE